MAIAIDTGTALVDETNNDAAEVNTRFSTLDSSIEDALSSLTEITDGINRKTTSVAAAAVKTIEEHEWDPSDGGNMTDDSSGIAQDYKMPSDADTQRTYGRRATIVKSDADGAEDGELQESVMSAGTLTEASALTKTGLDIPIQGSHFSMKGTKIIGGYDAMIDGATGTYTTLQLADDGLGANAYVYVKGGQTYAETLTIATDDSYWFFESSTVITSLVVSGHRNTIIFGASCQITGALTLSGNHNILHAGVLFNLDDDVTISGTGNECYVGPGSNLATTKTWLMSGANSKAIIGAEAAWPGIINMTADDTYLELGNQSVVTGATGLITGTGQKMVCGNEVQLVGNITVSANDAELHMGSTADIDGTVTLSGVRAVMTVGSIGNLAQTLACTGANSQFTCGDTTTITGAVSSDGPNARITVRDSCILSSTLVLTGANDRFYAGDSVQVVGNISTGTGGENYFEIGGDANIDGTVLNNSNRSIFKFGGMANLAQTLALSGTGSVADFGGQSTVTGIITQDGAQSQLLLKPSCQITAAVNTSGLDAVIRAGAKTDFGGIITLSGAGCSLICENGCDLDGIVVSGDDGYVDGGGWNTLVNGTTANHAISVTASGTIIRNIKAQTTGGGGQAYNAVNTSDWDVTLDRVWISGSDNNGIATSAVENIITNCFFSGTIDAAGISIGGANSVMVGNLMGTTIGGSSIAMGASGDNWLVVGNMLNDTGTNLDVNAAAENGLGVGNVHNGTFADGSGSSLVVTATDSDPLNEAF